MISYVPYGLNVIVNYVYNDIWNVGGRTEVGFESFTFSDDTWVFYPEPSGFILFEIERISRETN